MKRIIPSLVILIFVFLQKPIYPEIKYKGFRNTNLLISGWRPEYNSDKERKAGFKTIDALKKFKKVIQADSLSELSVSAAYFLGYQYDYKYAELDSAAKYYSWISSIHPNSEQNNIAKMRVQIIQNMLSTLKNDSTVTVN